MQTILEKSESYFSITATKLSASNLVIKLLRSSLKSSRIKNQCKKSKNFPKQREEVKDLVLQTSTKKNLSRKSKVTNSLKNLQNHPRKRSSTKGELIDLHY